MMDSFKKGQLIVLASVAILLSGLPFGITMANYPIIHAIYWPVCIFGMYLMGKDM
tara:strand:- start:159 stop:323 length:165 start_codon:yes stop_codon:yes gene_type:complete